MKRIIVIILSLISVQSVWAQNLSRNAIPSSGAYFNNGVINVSSSVGGIVSATLANSNNVLTQGYQQPAQIDTGVYVNLTAFIEAFYTGNNTMLSVFNDASIKTSNTVSDVIKVELHNSSAPYTLAYASNATINTNGTAKILFPTSAIGSSYYVVVKHRNAIETWSATPVAVTASGASYNYSNAANKAYGNNLSNMGNGVFAIYSGDITQDGSIDFNDYPDLDIGSTNGDLGYYATDINGDASVDFNDYPILDINSMNGVIAVTP